VFLIFVLHNTKDRELYGFIVLSGMVSIYNRNCVFFHTETFQIDLSDYQRIPWKTSLRVFMVEVANPISFSGSPGFKQRRLCRGYIKGGTINITQRLRYRPTPSIGLRKGHPGVTG